MVEPFLQELPDPLILNEESGIIPVCIPNGIPGFNDVQS
jgi:hypothetical protein